LGTLVQTHAKKQARVVLREEPGPARFDLGQRASGSFQANNGAVGVAAQIPAAFEDDTKPMIGLTDVVPEQEMAGPLDGREKNIGRALRESFSGNCLLILDGVYRLIATNGEYETRKTFCMWDFYSRRAS
jgi:hypothetical protein